MAPEQCLGKPVDRRSDVFALGIVLWELSTARRLFARASEHLTFKAICEERITPPSAIVPDYPPDLERIVLRALARRPADRHASAQELRRELLAWARGAGLVGFVAGVAWLVAAGAIAGALGAGRGGALFGSGSFAVAAVEPGSGSGDTAATVCATRCVAWRASTCFCATRSFCSCAGLMKPFSTRISPRRWRPPLRPWVSVAWLSWSGVMSLECTAIRPSSASLDSATIAVCVSVRAASRLSVASAEP